MNTLPDVELCGSWIHIAGPHARACLSQCTCNLYSGRGWLSRPTRQSVWRFCKQMNLIWHCLLVNHGHGC